MLSLLAMASASDDDPLLHWLRSLRQVKQTHPEDKSNLLPHVSDCYREFKDMERYRNDPRFLRICIQLADCSPDPLKVMADLDAKGIGHDCTLFYEAYATCLEAKRRFGDANVVYKRGLSSQAHPAEKLINSYKLFRDRMDIRKKRKLDQHEQHAKKSCTIAEEGLHARHAEDGVRQMASYHGADFASRSLPVSGDCYTNEGLEMSFEELRLASMNNTASAGIDQHEPRYQSTCVSDRNGTSSFGEETIQIRNFAAKAITGKEKDVEDARHHGLVDPTINTKEALQDILSMFRKPLDVGKKKETGRKRQDLVSISVGTSSPVLQDRKGQIKSSVGGLEFSVFKDDDQDQSQAETRTELVLLPHNGMMQTSSPPLGGLQKQAAECCVFKDGDDEPHVEPRGKPMASSPLPRSGKMQIRSPLGGLQTHSSEFELAVFRDDEQDSQVKPKSRPSENASIAVHLDKKRNSELLWVASSEKVAEESGFLVFKDEEAESEHAIGVYRDAEKPKDKSQCSTVGVNNQRDSDLFVFRDEPQRTSLQERKALEGRASRGKTIFASKTVACGIENVLPQSPLYLP